MTKDDYTINDILDDFYDYIIWGVSVFDDRETFLASGFNKNEDE